MEGRPIDNALAVVRPRCLSMAMDAQILKTAPVIDGDLELEVWGEPQFDGRFCRYPRETQLSEDRTQVWCGAVGGKLCLAFRCFQDPASVRNELPEHDNVDLVERRGRKYISLGRLFPYLTNVDSVGVTLPGYHTAIVTSAGGVYDGRSTAYGPITDWNGCTAKVARTTHGWCAEMALDLGERSFVAKRPKGPHRINFFRVGGAAKNAYRSAWVPATPRRWAIRPGTTGVVFFGADKQ